MKKWIITSLDGRYLVFKDPHKVRECVWARGKWRATRFDREEFVDFAIELYVGWFGGGRMPVKMEIWE